MASHASSQDCLSYTAKVGVEAAEAEAGVEVAEAGLQSTGLQLTGLLPPGTVICCAHPSGWSQSFQEQIRLMSSECLSSSELATCVALEMGHV